MEGDEIRIRDVYLADGVVSLLFKRKPMLEEDEASLFMMSDLGLPTSFTTSSKWRGYREHRKLRSRRKNDQHMSNEEARVSDVEALPFMPSDWVAFEAGEYSNQATVTCGSRISVDFKQVYNEGHDTMSSHKPVVDGDTNDTAKASLQGVVTEDAGVPDTEVVPWLPSDYTACEAGEHSNETVVACGRLSLSYEKHDTISNHDTIEMARASCQGISNEQEGNSDAEVLPWMPCWDDHYNRYYFYNTRTFETTWEPPKGLESFGHLYTVDGTTFQIGADFSSSANTDCVQGASLVEMATAEGGIIASPCASFSTEQATNLEVKHHNSVKAVLSDREHPKPDLSNLYSGTCFESEPQNNPSQYPRFLTNPVPNLDALHLSSTWEVLGDREHPVAKEDNLCDEINAEIESKTHVRRGVRFSITQVSHLGASDSSGIKEVLSDRMHPDPVQGHATKDNEEFLEKDASIGCEESILSASDSIKHDIPAQGNLSDSEEDNENFMGKDASSFSEESILLASDCIDHEAPEEAATCQDLTSRWRLKKNSNLLLRVEEQYRNIAAAMEDHKPSIFKYWIQRFHLFSKFNAGVKLDEEGWFSVTPEAIAKHHADRCNRGVIVDAFVGVGGNAIQFALAGHYVIAIDNDPRKIDYAHHNAIVYGVGHLIEFILGDFFVVSTSLKADTILLAPRWGGPEYQGVKIFDIQTMLQPVDGISLFKVAQSVAPNVIFFLPRNVNINQLAELSKVSGPPCSFEVERNYLNGKLKAVTAYYGQFICMETTVSLENSGSLRSHS